MDLTEGRTSADVVAVIPARGGSRGVPGKNLARVGGRRLVERAVDTCQAADGVDLTVVTTDSDEIADAAAAAGARVVRRPAELAGDTASSESAVLHALEVLRGDGVDPAVTALVQCTSPFVDPGDLAQAVKTVRSGAVDSCFAAAARHTFVWLTDAAGLAHGLNHDPAVRLRRQELAPSWHETGAFYVMRTAGLVARGHRFFGRIGVQPVDPATAVDVDEPRDLDLAAALAAVLHPTPTLRGPLP